MDYEMIAKTFMGLEPILARELTALGAKDVQIGCRMVSFKGDKAMMYRANFFLRTAVRILKPIERFEAKTADEVYEHIKAMDWTQYIHDRQTFAIDATVYSETFRNSRFVTYRVKDAIVDHFTEQGLRRPNISVATPDVRLNVHIAEERCTLSLDSSGESLHRRGYRQEGLEAPLNEVLAAGIILMTGWTGDCDFIDPMCGSGTLLIEAALIAQNMAPGVFRQEYAFEKWPDFDRDLLDEIYNDDSHEREFEHKIYGYDIDMKAVNTARQNIRAAGLSKCIEVEQADIKDFQQPAEKAIIVTNPPYGERITTPNLLDTYRTIGEVLKQQFQGNEAWVLSSGSDLFAAIHLKPSQSVPLYNGSIECELRKYTTFAGRYDDFRQDGGEVKSDDDLQRMEEKGQPRQRPAFQQRPEDARQPRFERDDRRPFEHGDRPHYDRGDRPSRYERDSERLQRFSHERDERPHRFDRDDNRSTVGRNAYATSHTPPSNEEGDIRTFQFHPVERQQRFNRFDRDSDRPRRFDRDGDWHQRGGRGDDGDRPHYERKPYGKNERREWDNRRQDRDQRPYDRNNRPYYNDADDRAPQQRRPSADDRRRMFEPDEQPQDN